MGLFFPQRIINQTMPQRNEKKFRDTEFRTYILRVFVPITDMRHSSRKIAWLEFALWIDGFRWVFTVLTPNGLLILPSTEILVLEDLLQSHDHGVTDLGNAKR